MPKVAQVLYLNKYLCNGSLKHNGPQLVSEFLDNQINQFHYFKPKAACGQNLKDVLISGYPAVTITLKP
jgi:hypothetical protein